MKIFKIQIAIIFFLFLNISYSNEKNINDIDNLIQDCNLICTGNISKAYLSNENLIYEIGISKVIYTDSNITLQHNLNDFENVQVKTIPNSIGYNNFNELYQYYVMFLVYDKSKNIYINQISFKLIWFESENLIHINKKEFENLKSIYYDNYVYGFINNFTNSLVNKDLIPEEIKQYKLKLFDENGREQTFIPLNNFLEYFNKIKSKKKD